MCCFLLQNLAHLLFLVGKFPAGEEILPSFTFFLAGSMGRVRQGLWGTDWQSAIAMACTMSSSLG